MPVARLSGVMCESEDRDHPAIRYDYQGEGKFLKNQSFCSQLGCIADNWDKWWVWFAEHCRCLLKGIDELLPQAWHLQFVPSSGPDQFFGSFRANLYLQNQPLI